jgi:hypothetical protein
MTEKKKKEEGISSETPKKKKPSGSGRLSGMIESMQRRGSPLNAHRVATRYFDSFRRERKIPAEGTDDEPAANISVAIDTGIDTAINTAIDSAVIKRERKTPRSSGSGIKSFDLKELDDSFTPSESSVYRAMYSRSIEKKAPTLRLGLKELRELTGLSDKTVRVAVHSLEEKRALRIVEPSLGIYGRKFRIFSPKETIEERLKAGVEIDPTTKKVVSERPSVNDAISTAIDTAADNEVSTAVYSAVGNAVFKDAEAIERKTDSVRSLYELYTGKKWDKEDLEYWKKIKNTDEAIIETALILTALKGKGRVRGFSDLNEVLGNLGGAPREGYLEQLREVWSAFNERG